MRRHIKSFYLTLAFFLLPVSAQAGRVSVAIVSPLHDTSSTALSLITKHTKAQSKFFLTRQSAINWLVKQRVPHKILVMPNLEAPMFLATVLTPEDLKAQERAIRHSPRMTPERMEHFRNQVRISVPSTISAVLLGLTKTPGEPDSRMRLGQVDEQLFVDLATCLEQAIHGLQNQKTTREIMAPLREESVRNRQ